MILLFSVSCSFPFKLVSVQLFTVPIPPNIDNIVNIGNAACSQVWPLYVGREFELFLLILLFLF